MKFTKLIKDVVECLEMFHYTNIEYLGNGMFKTTSPMMQERIFTLAKFGKDYTLYSQKGLKLPLPEDFEVFECEFVEEDSEGKELYKIYYSDYIIRSEVKQVFYSSEHNLKGIDLSTYPNYKTAR